uniref:FIP-RBD domain-containing protein n=1 Tax=Gadus morhua TaxID=8049 RepID=A0A8C5BKT8_GADMO
NNVYPLNNKCFPPEIQIKFEPVKEIYKAVVFVLLLNDIQITRSVSDVPVYTGLCPPPPSWYALESKPGKKRKERGRIQVSIQFMRNNMTASMFDLSSMKDKPRSPFSKLKGKMKGRKHDLPSDTSSAVLPRSALCDPEQPPPGPPRGPGAPAPPPETKAKRKLLAGSHKLSAAHSMSDLIGSPSLTGAPALLAFPGGPHRRSQSDVPDYAGVEGGDDPFGDLSDGLPQKYATLPRNHNPNPFQGGGAAAWEPGAERQKKEKVSLLERVTGKKDARKAANGARTGSTSDLRVANPFSADVQFTNPFKSSNDSSPPDPNPDLNQATAAAYSNLSFDEVVRELIKQKEVVRKKDSHIRELEDYIDNLLVRVMEETPSILRTPYEPKRKAGKISKK